MGTFLDLYRNASGNWHMHSHAHNIYNIDVIFSYSVILKSKPENDRNGETEQLLKHVVQE